MNHLVFGDVHGDAKSLSTLLLRARFAVGGGSPLTIYSTGDLIDRGPDSKEVIDLCLEHKVRLILGNHELWLHEWAKTGRANRKFAFSSIVGGKATVLSYGINPDSIRTDEALAQALDRSVPWAHKNYISSAGFFEEIPHGDKTYFLSHGGIPEDTGRAVWDTSEQFSIQNRIGCRGHEVRKLREHKARMLYDSLIKSSPDQILWIGAKKNKVFRLPEGCIQVFGHTPWSGGAEITDHYVALDTGCGTCPPFLLSGLLLHEDGRGEIVTSNPSPVRAWSLLTRPT